MKKIIISLCSIFFLFSLCACEDSNLTPTAVYNVDFIVLDEVYKTIQVKNGYVIKESYLNGVNSNVDYWYVLVDEKEVKVTTVTINEDTCIYASVSNDSLCTVNFIFPSDLTKYNYSKEYVLGSKVVLENYSFEDKNLKFLNWYTDRNNPLKVTSIVVTNDIDVYCRIEVSLILPAI